MEVPYRDEEMYLDKKDSNDKELNETKNKADCKKTIIISIISIICPIIESIILFFTVIIKEHYDSGFLSPLGTIIYGAFCFTNECMSIYIGVLYFYLYSKNNNLCGFICFVCLFILKGIITFYYFLLLVSEREEALKIMLYINITFYIIYGLICLIYIFLLLIKLLIKYKILITI